MVELEPAGAAQQRIPDHPARALDDEAHHGFALDALAVHGIEHESMAVEPSLQLRPVRRRDLDPAARLQPAAGRAAAMAGAGRRGPRRIRRPGRDRAGRSGAGGR